MIGVTTSGSLDRLRNKIDRMRRGDIFASLDSYGAAGVAALAAATPTETGLTGASWYYEITRTGGIYRLSWHNSHVQSGAIIAILIDSGHATRTGGYVPGRNYIRPAITPIFERLRAEVRKGMTT